MGSQEASLPPHVLIFPLPIQGHMNIMLKLAELLCIAKFDATFMVSEFSHNRLLKYTNIVSDFSRYPGFRFQTISDGLPDDHPRAGERAKDIVPATKKVTEPLFKQMMIDENCFGSNSKRTITCIIADGFLSFAGDFAIDNGIPLIYYQTTSACSFWASFFTAELIEAGEIPIKGNGMDLLVKSVPGMEDFLRRRDLPTFCRVDDINDSNLHVMKSENRQTSRAQAVILNTFEDLEAPILDQIRKHMPRLYTIGPNSSIVSGSLWEQDRTCLTWLNTQPPQSVIYVSFGSMSVVTKDQVLELWHGLANSGQRFLWVMRPDSLVGQDGKKELSLEQLKEVTKERGYMVEWAPQEEVLNHPAIGGFLTHSGWNSTLESILAGVPMLCWPYFADQMVNSRFVSEIWNIGLDMKDTCDRVIIEKMVRDLMEVRKDEFLERSKQMANLARAAVKQGGSSNSNVGNLIQYIRSMIA